MLRQLKQTASRANRPDFGLLSALRLHPSPMKNIYCGIKIPIQGEATIRTAMNTNGQSLFHYHPATGANLTCLPGGNFSVPTSGAFSLGFEYREELSPSGIGNAFSEMPVLDHVSDAKIFYREPVVSLDEAVSDFVMKVQSLVRDLFMFSGDGIPGLLSAGAAFLSPAEGPLGNSQQKPSGSPRRSRRGGIGVLRNAKPAP